LEKVLEQRSEFREQWLAIACRGDEGLQKEVASLLHAHEAAEHFIERPLLRLEITAA